MQKNLWTKEIILDSVIMSFKKLNPKVLARNPVIFVTALGSLLSTLTLFYESNPFIIQINCWLWFTVIFANFSEALAEGRGRAQAESLRKNKQDLKAKLFDMKSSQERVVAASLVKKGEIVICKAGDTIPRDGEVIAGVASVDESAITGESAPVIRESGGDRSAVTGGTTVKSDWIIIKVTADLGESFVDKMILLIEGAKRQKTPNEIALTLVLSGLTIIMLCVVVSLKFFVDYSAHESSRNFAISIPVLVSLFVCLIPTTIGGLLSAIGISGMNRLIKSNVIAKSGRAVEAAGDISVLLLDKTGTITYGNRRAYELIPAEGVKLEELAASAYLASLSDETAEGRSIVELCEGFVKKFVVPDKKELSFIPFSAETRMSGVDIKGSHAIRKGSVDAIVNYAKNSGTIFSKFLDEQTQKIAQQGGTPLLVIDDKKIMGVIYLKDVVKTGIREKFNELRKIGIKTIMITGDNPLTAASIAAEAGVDDFMAQATPEDKLKKIRLEQSKGHLVAMTGDGTNDAPALAQADVGVAMNSGTQAAREACNMVDLDSDPTKLINVVEVGKQLLITRGALTTFSFANDIAKYFAILPAIFIPLYATNTNDGPLQVLNIMQMHSPESSILSAVVFNALIIIFLTPLALKGVKFTAISTEKILQRNILIYGVGGVIVPFVGIKLIDIIINGLGLI